MEVLDGGIAKTRLEKAANFGNSSFLRLQKESQLSSLMALASKIL